MPQGNTIKFHEYITVNLIQKFINEWEKRKSSQVVFITSVGAI